MATTSLAQPAIQSQTDAPTPLRLWHLTSLDAPTVAVTWTLTFAWATQIRLPLWLPITLALASWSAYIADRLLDAYRAQKAINLHSESGAETCSLIPVPYSLSLRPRHHFHWKHRRFFIPLALAAALAALSLVLINMPLAARERNSVLAAAALAYFTSVHNPWRLPSPKFRLRLPKELLVALIFTLACAIPTWTRIPTRRLELLIPTLAFIALAWLNCQAIETWESATPRRNPIFPLAATLAAITALIATIFLAEHQTRIAALLAAAATSAALLALLDRHRHRVTPTTIRAAADLVLLTPLALLIPTALGH